MKKIGKKIIAPVLTITFAGICAYAATVTPVIENKQVKTNSAIKSTTKIDLFGYFNTNTIQGISDGFDVTYRLQQHWLWTPDNTYHTPDYNWNMRNADFKAHRLIKTLAINECQLLQLIGHLQPKVDDLYFNEFVSLCNMVWLTPHISYFAINGVNYADYEYDVNFLSQDDRDNLSPRWQQVYDIYSSVINFNDSWKIHDYVICK